MTNYTFVSDPGHGWLQVPLNELDALGITGQISMYSYVEGDTVWLEEDCDLSTYLHARFGTMEEIRAFMSTVKDVTVNGDSYIRNLARGPRTYSAPDDACYYAELGVNGE